MNDDVQSFCKWKKNVSRRIDRSLVWSISLRWKILYQNAWPAEAHFAVVSHFYMEQVKHVEQIKQMEQMEQMQQKQQKQQMK